MKSYEEMDLPELYTAMVAMDELIAQMAKFGVNDPRHHARRSEVAEVIERRFPDVPVEAFATAEGPAKRPLGMVNPTLPPPSTKRYARVAYGSVLDYREIADEDIARERKARATEGIELLLVDDQRVFDDSTAAKFADKVKIKPDRVVLTRVPLGKAG